MSNTPIKYFLLIASFSFSMYGTFCVRSDRFKGRVRMRGGRVFGALTHPKTYRSIMAFNTFAVVLLWLGTAVLALETIYGF